MTANREIYVDFLCQIKFQQGIAADEQRKATETPNKTLQRTVFRIMANNLFVAIMMTQAMTNKKF